MSNNVIVKDLRLGLPMFDGQEEMATVFIASHAHISRASAAKVLAIAGHYSVESDFPEYGISILKGN